MTKKQQNKSSKKPRRLIHLRQWGTPNNLIRSSKKQEKKKKESGDNPQRIREPQFSEPISTRTLTGEVASKKRKNKFEKNWEKIIKTSARLFATIMANYDIILTVFSSLQSQKSSCGLGNLHVNGR